MLLNHCDIQQKTNSDIQKQENIIPNKKNQSFKTGTLLQTVKVEDIKTQRGTPYVQEAKRLNTLEI